MIEEQIFPVPSRLDAEPGGPALTQDPFQTGRLHMLQREEAIYRASYAGKTDGRTPGETAWQDAARSAEDIACIVQGLQLRQSQERDLFNAVLAAGTALDMRPKNGLKGQGRSASGATLMERDLSASGAIPQGGPAAGGEQAVNGEAQDPPVSADCAFPVFASPEDLDPPLAAFFDFVREGGPLFRHSCSALFPPASLEPPARQRIYGLADPAWEGPEADPYGGPVWMHVREYDFEKSDGEEALFPHRRARGSRFARGPKDRADDKKHAPETGAAAAPRKDPGRFAARLARIAVFVGILALGYVVLSGKGCGV